MQIPPPYSSEEPADWFMYCDMLQDAGCSRYVWQRALRIAQSLQEDPRLVLLNCAKSVTRRVSYWHCQEQGRSLLRRYVWCRQDWLEDIDPIRGCKSLCENQLPFTCSFYQPTKEVAGFLAKYIHIPRARLQFFYTHSLRRLPDPQIHFANRF